MKHKTRFYHFIISTYLQCPAARRPHRRVRRGRGVGGGCGVCKTRTSDILGQFSDLPRSGAGRGGGRPLAQPDAGGVHGGGLLPPDLLGQTAVDGLLVVEVSLNNLRVTLHYDPSNLWQERSLKSFLQFTLNEQDLIVKRLCNIKARQLKKKIIIKSKE